ncbi:MAG: hypothetical protein AB7V04_08240 [Desulfomonilaceae bacterium]
MAHMCRMIVFKGIYEIDTRRSRMKTLLVLAVLMMGSSVVQADKVVRDRYGNLVETWRDRGGRTEVRDRYGNLEETRTRRGDEIIVRDRYGNTIGTEKIDR